jgi:hypothetical protein
MLVDKMPVEKMPVDEMPLDGMTCCQEMFYFNWQSLIKLSLLKASRAAF